MFVRRSGEKPDDAPQDVPAVRDEPTWEATAPTAVSGKKLLKKMQKPRKSVIDAGVIIAGTVACTGEVEILGQVQGDLHCSLLAVSQPGHISGDVYAESAIIDGRVDGTIRSKQVVLRSGAHVTGDIHHASLVIEHGAIFEGKVRRSNNPTQAQPKAAEPQPRPANAVAAQPHPVAPAPQPMAPAPQPRAEPVAQPTPQPAEETETAHWPPEQIANS